MPGTSRDRPAALRAAGLGALAMSASACAGLATGNGGMVFLATRFWPVVEADAYRSLPADMVPGSSYVPIEDGPCAGQVRSQLDAGSTQVGLLGGGRQHEAADSILSPVAGRAVGNDAAMRETDHG